MEAELETQPEGSITATQPNHLCAAQRLSAGLSALDCSVLVLVLVWVSVSVSVSVCAPPGSLRVPGAQRAARPKLWRGLAGAPGERRRSS